MQRDIFKILYRSSKTLPRLPTYPLTPSKFSNMPKRASTSKVTEEGSPEVVSEDESAPVAKKVKTVGFSLVVNDRLMILVV